MCLIAFAWGMSERFPFVIAANRDEYLARPTAPLALWQTPSGATVLSGRDLQDGGTWMGFSANGRFAMLTNVREPHAAPPRQPISRGGLALSWLESEMPADRWAKTLEPQRYQGFNLIIGDWHAKQCHYFHHQQISKSFGQLAVVLYAQSAPELVAINMLQGAVYGLSNAALDTPWPKTLRLKAALQHSLGNADAMQLIAHNLHALADQSKPSASDLPATGVSQELELALSSAFVRHPQSGPTYGTRTSLVAVLQPECGLQATEVTHDHDGGSSTQSHQTLAWA